MSSSFYGPLSPIPKYGIPDYPKDSSLWRDWIDEQEHYILNGFTAGGTTISGRYYFSLNFCPILGLGEDGYERKQYSYIVDAWREFYDLVEECLKPENGKDIIVGKGRDKGFSYEIAKMALYETQFHDNTSVLGLFPSGESKAVNKFKEKYDMAWAALPHDMRYYPDLSESKDIYKYGWHETDNDTKQRDELGANSSLTMLRAVNADVAKSGRYKLVLMEEFGEIKNPLDLIITNRANLKKGKYKFGLTVAGGTSNALNFSYKEFRELWYNHAAYGFEKFFIPAHKAYWGFVNYQTGESDLEGAKEHILQERKGLRDDKLTIQMQNYPLDEAEMFTSAAKSPYNSLICSKRINEILGDSTVEKAIQRGNLYLKKNDKGEMVVEFHLDPNGRWRIFKNPAKGLLHPDVGGVDSYRFGDIDNPESKGAIVIYRPFQGMGKIGSLPICVYWHRHKNKEDFFEDCLLTAMYYNCKLLIERSDEDIFTYFKQRMARKYLKEEPKLIQSLWTSASVKYGVAPSIQNIKVAVEYSANEFEKNYDNYVFVELLDELIKFGAENTDIADAFKWAVMHAYDNVQVLPEYKKETTKKFRPYTVSDGRGGLVVVNSPEIARLYGNRN